MTISPAVSRLKIRFTKTRILPRTVMALLPWRVDSPPAVARGPPPRASLAAPPPCRNSLTDRAGLCRSGRAVSTAILHGPCRSRSRKRRLQLPPPHGRRGLGKLVEAGGQGRLPFPQQLRLDRE